MTRITYPTNATIYCIVDTDADRVIYVGSTGGPFKRRCYSHSGAWKRALKSKVNIQPIYRYMKQQRKGCIFEIKPIVTWWCMTKWEVEEREKRIILRYEGGSLLNKEHKRLFPREYKMYNQIEN